MVTVPPPRTRPCGLRILRRQTHNLRELQCGLCSELPSPRPPGSRSFLASPPLPRPPPVLPHWPGMREMFGQKEPRSQSAVPSPGLSAAPSAGVPPEGLSLRYTPW